MTALPDVLKQACDRIRSGDISGWETLKDDILTKDEWLHAVAEYLRLDVAVAAFKLDLPIPQITAADLARLHGLQQPEKHAHNDVEAAPPFELKSLGDFGWMENEPPPRRGSLFMQDGDQRAILIPAGHSALLIGEGGSSKTQFMVQLTSAIATGGQFLGKHSPLWAESPMAVLFVAAEESSAELHRRFYWLGRRLGPAERQLLERNVFPLGLAGLGRSTALLSIDDERTKQTSMTPLAIHIREILDREPPNSGNWGALLLDPAARLGPPGFERDETLATRFMECTDRMCATRDAPLVLTAHHTNKNSRRDDSGPMNVSASRGITALTDAARFVMALGPDTSKNEPADVLLSVVKTNYTRRPKRALRIVRSEQDGSLSIMPGGQQSQDAPASNVKEENLKAALKDVRAFFEASAKKTPGDVHSKREVQTKVGGNAATIRTAMDDLVKQGILVVGARVGGHPQYRLAGSEEASAKAPVGAA